MDRRAESDNHGRKEQRARAAAKNVSAKFVVRFHSYTSVLRPRALVAIDPCGKRARWSSQETPNELDADSSVLRHFPFLWQYPELGTNAIDRGCRLLV